MNLLPIGRAFASEQDALESVESLKSRNFQEEDMSVITPAMIEASDASMLSRDVEHDVDPAVKLAELIIGVHEASRVPESHALVYADAVQEGKTLLLITAPFGQAQLANVTLDKGKIVELGELPELPEHTWIQPAPLSALLNWPVLTHRRSWMSRTFPELKQSDSLPTKGILGGLLSHNPAPLSSKVGMSVLKENPAPLSSKVGMSVLKDNPTPLSSKLGMSVLKDNPTPLSSKLGISVLKDNPSPLSDKVGMSPLSSSTPGKKDSSFGFPLLLDNATPLSSFFGISTLKKND